MSPSLKNELENGIFPWEWPIRELLGFTGVNSDSWLLAPNFHLVVLSSTWGDSGKIFASKLEFLLLFKVSSSKICQNLDTTLSGIDSTDSSIQNEQNTSAQQANLSKGYPVTIYSLSKVNILQWFHFSSWRGETSVLSGDPMVWAIVAWWW